jgi:hypothetical protein
VRTSCAGSLAYRVPSPRASASCTSSQATCFLTSTSFRPRRFLLTFSPTAPWRQLSIGVPCQLNYIKTATQHVIRITRANGLFMVLPNFSDGLVRVAMAKKGSL